MYFESEVLVNALIGSLICRGHIQQLLGVFIHSCHTAHVHCDILVRVSSHSYHYRFIISIKVKAILGFPASLPRLRLDMGKLVVDTHERHLQKEGMASGRAV